MKLFLNIDCLQCWVLGSRDGQPQTACNKFKKGSEADVGTLAKAPGGRKSVLGKEDGNETSPSLALGLARLQGRKGLEELEKSVAGGGNS